MIWAIGNGESRKHININQLSGIKVGCNAIARDFKLQHLICVDRRMVVESIELDTAKTIYTRPEWHDQFKTFSQVKTVPALPYSGNERCDEAFQWGSGPYAVLLAAQLTNNLVNMIGFDLYGQNKKINNIYKDTKNYDKSEKTAIDPRYWIHQISMIFKCYPNIQFKIYQTDNWDMPLSWKHTNVCIDKISKLY